MANKVKATLSKLNDKGEFVEVKPVEKGVKLKDIITELSKTQKSIRNFYTTPKLKGSLKLYIASIKALELSLQAYIKNPMENLNQIAKFCDEVVKVQKKVDKDYLYKLAEEEIQENENQIKALRKQMEADKETVKLAKFIVSNHKPQIKQNTKPKAITLSPNFDDFDGQTKEIYNLTTSLFSASLEQWQNLFSNNIQVFKAPIELKSNTTISDLRLFLDTLYSKRLIKKQRFNKVLENVKAFSYEGKVLVADQYKNAKQIENYPHTKNYIKVSEIFTALNLDD
ncbi:MAG: hypothetical protein OIF50_04935 [Flavobacteriaceae bacterium]|nr:hypothetical protein [Flavobacteriaceae bacterium]